MSAITKLDCQPAARLQNALRRRVALSVCAVFLVGALSPVAGAGPQAGGKGADKPKPTVLTEDNEVRIGRENAEDNDKQIKLVTDAALVERVNRIGQEIADVANTTPIAPLWGSPQVKQFKYTFKIVDDKDVNAYSLPGGFIYVNKGLLDYVHSDDELAGVLAHEISHAAHHHMMKLMREQNKMQAWLPLLAGLLVATKASINDIVNVANAAELFMTAKRNSYGVDAEKDADHSGLLLLTHTRYNPAGLYSFMVRLAADERNRSYGDLGIFRTHPPGVERVAAAKALLTELNIPIEMSKLDPTLQAEIVPREDGSGLVQILIRKVVVCEVVAANGLTATERAQKIGRQLNTLMDAHLQGFEVRAIADQSTVLARHVPILIQADADARHKPLTELARDMAAAIAEINQKQQISPGGDPVTPPKVISHP